MPIGKLTLADIKVMRDEIATNEAFAKPLIREAERLNEISQSRKLTLPEERRLNELLDLMKQKNVEVAKLRQMINDFYAPATA